MSPRSTTGILTGGRSAQAGSSLVELLISMALTAIVSTGLYTFFTTTSVTYSDQAVTARMLQSATTAMARIAQDIR
ncbi:MAG TPA: prepilin-type N-terminal cleavage/methylation domain-containing protein, partial [Candidatus Methylomirabilis sp.]|nr:prepilin-type N-terminal cleavage/methylation domain-containing protein [Candidatus Methylomirabilis sp.]